jgi:hypothetical protein
MGIRAIWEVKAACVRDANPITTDKSRWLRKNMVTNAIFPYAPRGVTGILTYILVGAAPPPKKTIYNVAHILK